MRVCTTLPLFFFLFFFGFDSFPWLFQLLHDWALTRSPGTRTLVWVPLQVLTCSFKHNSTRILVLVEELKSYPTACQKCFLCRITQWTLNCRYGLPVVFLKSRECFLPSDCNLTQSNSITTRLPPPSTNGFERAFQLIFTIYLSLSEWMNNWCFIVGTDNLSA